MKTFLPLIVCTFLFQAIPTTPLNAQEEKETQYWTGTLEVQGVSLRLNLLAERQANGWSGTLYSVDQGNTPIPVSRLSLDEKEMTLEADSILLKFSGSYNSDRSAVTGTLTQFGKKHEFTFKRVESFDSPEKIEHWVGVLDADNFQLQMGVQVFRDQEGRWSAKLDSYSQGATGIPANLTVDGDQYRLQIGNLPIEYEATLNDDKDRLIGTFTQNGVAFPLNMKKVALDYKPDFSRPQMPEPPFPYESRIVQFPNEKESINLAGTLTVPKGEGPFTAAVLISGSGAQDRDESLLGHKPFLVIADHLTRNGIAVLRFDDRGTGESTGNYAEATSADLANDVAAAVDFLTTQPEIDSARIGLIGHSEGGLIAPLVAVEHDVEIAFIILLAGPGVDGGEILKSQTRAMLVASGVSKPLADAADQVYEAIFDEIRSTEAEITAESIQAIANQAVAECNLEESLQSQLQGQFSAAGRMFTSPWLQYFIQHDPAAVLAQVRCPILALNGAKDLQVLADLNLNAIQRTLEEAGHSDFEIKKLENMNHLFQETEGTGLPVDYAHIEQTFSPKAIEIMVDWIQANTGSDHSKQDGNGN